MSDMNETLSIRLPPELRRDLNRLCKRQRRPASDVAREALRRYIATEEFRALRRRLRPYAEAKGFLTDEDFFDAIS
jgi:predicted transcriptional regulator